MSKSFCIFSFAGMLVATLSNSSQASVDKKIHDKIFISASLGLNRPSSLRGNAGLDQSKNGHFYSIALGKELNEIVSFSLELNGTQRKATSTDISKNRLPANSWSVKSYGLYLNALLYMTKNEEIKPYIKIGGGYSYNRVKDYTRVIGPSLASNDPRIYHVPGVSSRSKSYQIGVGVNFNGSDSYAFRIEYSMIHRGKIKTVDHAIFVSTGKTVAFNTVDGKLVDNVLSIGVKFRM